MSRDRPSTSPTGRLLKLGGLVGRVGASLAVDRLLELVRSEEGRDARRSESLARNAARVVETLGKMKGATMKLGQMASLHDGLLPPEVSAVLRSLQKEAPRVPPEVMEAEIRGQLSDFDRLFFHLDPEGFAAASIGQVHRGRLRDGREVAVKIQYPLIDEIVRADLRNLRTLLQALFRLFSDADFEPVWAEVRDRLLEELDYRHEADNLGTMAGLHAEVDEILIPEVVDEATSSRVLTMEFVEGLSPDEACSREQPSGLRDRWGRTLLEFQLRGLFEHRVLHADPNLANFAFRPDGRVVVYDFGCIKRVPAEIARGYAGLMLAVLEGRREDIPGILREMGVHREDGTPVPQETVEPWADVFSEIVRESPPYTFGEDGDLYEDLLSLGRSQWSDARDLLFPRDIVFVDRALGGHVGNLHRLRATGPWRDLIRRYAQSGVRS